MVFTVEGPGEGAPRSLTDPLVLAAEVDGERTAVTFVEYESSKDGVAWSLTRRELHRRVRAVAAWLAQRCEPGERVAIMAPQGLEYVVGFLGAVHAGLIAVPLFTPDLPGHGDRLERVLDDCAPAAVLTASSALEPVRELLRSREDRVPRECVPVDTLPDSYADEYEKPEIDPDDIAYLQYTSGSTRTPTGVVLTHANALANARQTLEAYGGTDPDATSVSWLPLFHDMGLVLSIAAPIVGGLTSVLMDPVAFLQRPGRWLRLLSVHSGAISAAPNFAYDYCAARVTEEEKAWLRLDDVISLLNGSEPVRPSTVDRFHAAFAECGLRPDTHRSSYGLAEATVFVSATSAYREPTVARFDRQRLGAGVAEPPRAESTAVSTLVGCGTPLGQRIAIVDPASRERLIDGEVGEIWVHGPNTGRGYWNADPVTSGEIFDATLISRDLPENGWLRTGDLGVFHQNELFVTGRMKDLIIVDGRNHYPQDIEETVEQAHPAVRNHHSAAFSADIGDAEKLVVVAEFSRRYPEEERDPAEIGRLVSKAVSSAHGVVVHELVLVEPDVVPRTSSGKVARRLCRERYVNSELAGGTGDE